MVQEGLKARLFYLRRYRTGFKREGRIRSECDQKERLSGEQVLTSNSHREMEEDANAKEEFSDRDCVKRALEVAAIDRDGGMVEKRSQ